MQQQRIMREMIVCNKQTSIVKKLFYITIPVILFMLFLQTRSFLLTSQQLISKDLDLLVLSVVELMETVKTEVDQKSVKLNQVLDKTGNALDSFQQNPLKNVFKKR